MHDLGVRGEPGKVRLIPASLAAALILFLTLLLFALPTGQASEAKVFREYEVKAAFLYNFVLFTDWPASSFPNERAPIVVGILGKNPFEDYLQRTIAGKTVNRRPLTLKTCRTVAEARSCHLLFVSASEKTNVPGIIQELGDASILTVGDTEDFATRGGMINLVVSGQTVLFQVNRDAAVRAKLKINSQVLELAEIVSGRTGSPKQ